MNIYLVERIANYNYDCDWGYVISADNDEELKTMLNNRHKSSDQKLEDFKYIKIANECLIEKGILLIETKNG